MMYRPGNGSRSTLKETRSMITDQASANQSKPGSGQEPTNVERRTLIGAGLAALLTAACSSPTENRAQRLSSSGLVTAAERDEGTDEGGSELNDPFILLLKGVYQPVVHGPNLGLHSVNLSDGSYSVTRIYPVFGISKEGDAIDQDKAIGKFYVQFAGNLCAYDLPGGAIAMKFNSVPAGAPPGFNGFVPFPDGKGGQYLEGTFELKILEATGVYSAFQGGHNHMVDRLHQLASGQYDEFCFCDISTYQFP